MSQTLSKFYHQYCESQIKKALAPVTGHMPNVVTEDALFRQLVIDPSWQALPSSIKKAGRDNIRWDEFFLTLRKTAFKVDNGKLALRADVLARAENVIQDMFGAPVPAPITQTVPPAAPVTQAAPPAQVPPARPTSAPIRQAPPAPLTNQTAIGIDLGTTYSVIAHIDGHGRPCTINNSAGDLITPSVILMDEGGPVIGKEAVMAASMEPENIAVCVKRDMGARTYRKKVGKDHFPPEVLSSLILKTLKEDAERKLGPVKYATITVPAYFDEARRRATIDAGRLAGLDVLGIINEPTAAAIAYGYQVGFLNKKGQTVGGKPVRVLVYDLGGGTFDVTILQIEGSSFKAIATDGDVTLGGKDWDEKLLEIAANRVKTELREDPRTNPHTMEDLWQAAEIAKKTLTERNKTTMYINHLGARHKVEVTRQEFEEATASLLGRTRTTTEIVLRQAGMKWTDISNILLVGGSTRMPMIVRMLEEISGKKPEQSISPDEAVAHGAALYAELLLQKRLNSDRPPAFSVTNVNSHSLGIVGFDKASGRKRNQILIPKNTPLPYTFSGVFKTHKPNQPNILIRIVEGESERPEACAQLGTCKVDPLPANLPADWPVHVTYSYLADGQLEVSAQIKGQNAAAITVLQRENNMAEDEMAKWNQYMASMNRG